MDTTLVQELAFLEEIRRQISYAMKGVEAMNAACLEGREPDHNRFWPGFEDFVLATAQMSKMFWPITSGSEAAKKAKAARGSRLRHLLGVAEDSPIYSRACRNHLEHFDERIDTWLGAGTRGLRFDFNVFSGYSDDDPALRQQMRAINLSTGSIIVLGEVLRPQPIVDALGELWNRVPGAVEQARKDHQVDRTS